ncbi:MAG: hypothetical protein R6U68_13530 [Desulfobacteraceae bacterium]
MKSIQAQFDKSSNSIQIKKDAQQEDWIDVCEKFNNDVERICYVDDQEDYTALYQCFDENNREYFYLVKEEKELYALRRRHFLNKIGKKI